MKITKTAMQTKIEITFIFCLKSPLGALFVKIINLSKFRRSKSQNALTFMYITQIAIQIKKAFTFLPQIGLRCIISQNPNFWANPVNKKSKYMKAYVHKIDNENSDAD